MIRELLLAWGIPTAISMFFCAVIWYGYWNDTFGEQEIAHVNKIGSRAMICCMLLPLAIVFWTVVGVIKLFKLAFPSETMDR